MKLFADDLDASVAFYVEQRDPGYVSVRRGDVVLGLRATDQPSWPPPRAPGRGACWKTARCGGRADLDRVDP
ncbi:hypothetical protein [Dactylosporangium sp. CA-233914]|uniref:hypothetical protein n=1 Tax=Dactylosporangium sp. CA-233914 TaxID=3239934 RepID=UPI003D931AC8